MPRDKGSKRHGKRHPPKRARRAWWRSFKKLVRSIIVRQKKVKMLKCPGCGSEMEYRGKGYNSYECTNPRCRVIEVRFNTFLKRIIEIKKATVL